MAPGRSRKFNAVPTDVGIDHHRHGSVVLRYAKVHTCDFGDEAKLTSGRESRVAKLDAR
jgi:hypothetical protein